MHSHSDVRLQKQTHHLEALYQSRQDGLILEDLQGQVLYANRRIQEMASLAGGAGDMTLEAGVAVAELMERILAQTKDPAAAHQAVQFALNGEANRQADFTVVTGERPR